MEHRTGVGEKDECEGRVENEEANGEEATSGEGGNERRRKRKKEGELLIGCWVRIVDRMLVLIELLIGCWVLIELLIELLGADGC